VKLFDLHSDTLYEAKRRSLSPVSSKALQAPIGVSPFEKTHRISAIWCDNTLDDSACWQEYLSILAYTKEALEKEPLPDTVTLDYAVEDARLIENSTDRLQTLAMNGTKILTLTWQGLSVIGGAWDTEAGLTDLGKSIVRDAATLGITLDISHASDATAKDTLRLSERYGTSVIASHSNSRAVCPHMRNLSDYLFDALAERRSPVGISLVPHHLETNGSASPDSILRHITHFLSRKNGEKTLAIGSDLDGVSSLPEGFKTLADLGTFYRLIEKTLGKALADAIFYDNASAFFTRN